MQAMRAIVPLATVLRGVARGRRAMQTRRACGRHITCASESSALRRRAFCAAAALRPKPNAGDAPATAPPRRTPGPAHPATVRDPLPTVPTASVSDDGTSVTVEFPEPLPRTRATHTARAPGMASGAARFHARWLWYQCPSFVSSSGQRTVAPLGTRKPRVTRVRVVPAVSRATSARVRVSWDNGHESDFDAAFLQQHSYSHGRAERRSSTLQPPTLRGTASLPEVSYDTVMDSDEGVLEWCRHLNGLGACLVRNVPTVLGTVKQVADRIHETRPHIYGDVFDVKSEPEAINIAYTSVGLAPHVDLMYLESPPGLQFLHCMRFDEDVKGGESTLVDVLHVAEELRRTKPESFRTLCELPNTFQKVHYARASPVDIVYQRHHIVVNHVGEVVAVNWSPPFEGPLCLPDRDVERFYDAYQDFEAQLQRTIAEQGVVIRLRPGDMLSFNNRRTLHGRTVFESTNQGVRHLQGCYVNIDDFHNRHMTLQTRYGSPGDVVHRIGNHNMM